jgi:hypothetical protein
MDRSLEKTYENLHFGGNDTQDHYLMLGGRMINYGSASKLNSSNCSNFTVLKLLKLLPLLKVSPSNLTTLWQD